MAVNLLILKHVGLEFFKFRRNKRSSLGSKSATARSVLPFNSNKVFLDRLSMFNFRILCQQKIF